MINSSLSSNKTSNELPKKNEKNEYSVKSRVKFIYKLNLINQINSRNYFKSSVLGQILNSFESMCRIYINFPILIVFFEKVLHYVKLGANLRVTC